MTTLQDFESLWQAAGFAWAKTKVSDGADNVDAWHTNKLFQDYFSDYGLTVAAGTPTYTATSASVLPKALYTTTYSNNTPTPTTGLFSFSKAVTDTFSVSVTEALKISATVGAKLALDGIGEASASLTAEVSVSSTQTQTTTETNTWMVNQTIPEPANSVTVVTFYVAESVLMGTANVPVTISGSVAVGLNSPWNGHYFWFVPLALLLQESGMMPSWLTANNDGSVTFEAAYNLSGVSGLNAYVTLSNQSGNVLERVAVAHPGTIARGVSPR